MSSKDDKSKELTTTPTLSIETYKPEGLEEYQRKVTRCLFKPRGSEAPEKST